MKVIFLNEKMSLIEDHIVELIINFIWKLFKVIGTLISYPVLFKKYHFHEIENEFWSGIIGVIFVSFILFIVLIF